MAASSNCAAVGFLIAICPIAVRPVVAGFILRLSARCRSGGGGV